MCIALYGPHLYLCTEIVKSWVSLIAADREQVDVREVRVHKSRVHAHCSNWGSGGLWTEVKKVTFGAGTVEDVGVKLITVSRGGSLREVGEREREREGERILWPYVATV